MEACGPALNPVIMGPVDVKGLGGGKHHLSSTTRKVGVKGAGSHLEKNRGMVGGKKKGAKSPSTGRRSLGQSEWCLWSCLRLGGGAWRHTRTAITMP